MKCTNNLLEDIIWEHRDSGTSTSAANVVSFKKNLREENMILELGTSIKTLKSGATMVSTKKITKYKSPEGP